MLFRKARITVVAEPFDGALQVIFPITVGARQVGDLFAIAVDGHAVVGVAIGALELATAGDMDIHAFHGDMSYNLVMNQCFTKLGA